MEQNTTLTAQVVVKNRSQWTNKHQNFTQRIERLYDVWNPTSADLLSGMKATVATLQSLIGEAVREGARLRALGSGWSFSRVAVTDGRLVNTAPLNVVFRISSTSVSHDYAGEQERLLFVQCGTSLAELNQYLATRQQSLTTSGASNGQTIVGAMSTGTHGSAIDVGAIQDHIVGLHLIVGPARQIWLERRSYPVVSDAFVQQISAELIRDDTLFNAALVSFGSFGFIHAVMIETVPIFLLEAHRQRMPLDSKLRRAIDTLDFSELPLPHGSERPYYFDVIINPHDLQNGVFVRTMYKRPYTQDHRRDADDDFVQLRPGDDLLAVLGVLSDALPELIPGVMNALSESRLKEFSNKVGTLGEIFDNTSTRGKAAGAAMGVPLSFASKALDTVLAVHEAEGPFAGVFALRFVKRSQAALAFTRFDPTCVVDLDGVFSKRSTGFFRRVWTTFAEAHIPYTVHWGKINNLDAAQVRRMYESAVDQWLASRRTLLDEASRRVFANSFLEHLDLAT